MRHHDLLEYIREAKSYGASDAAIADRLHGAGWYRVDVQDGLQLYRKMTQSAQLTSAPFSPTQSAEPAQGYSSSPVAIAVLAFVAGFVAYLLLIK